jgi:hypothetical protein
MPMTLRVPISREKMRSPFALVAAGSFAVLTALVVLLRVVVFLAGAPVLVAVFVFAGSFIVGIKKLLVISEFKRLFYLFREVYKGILFLAENLRDIQTKKKRV